MTRDEIMNMPAGKEIDKLIANKVLGVFVDSRLCPYCGCEMWIGAERSRCSNCNEWRYSPYKQYSCEIEDAWIVVEALKEDVSQGFDLCTSVNGWMANFGGGVIGYGETPSLAICRAALLAIPEVK